MGLLSRLADKKGKPYVGSRPPVLPGRVLAGLLWAARSYPVEQKIGTEREVFEDKREIIGSQRMGVYTCQIKWSVLKKKSL